MSADDVAARIESFLRAHLGLAADDRWFSRRTNLWEDGYVDSIGVVELIDFIETTFGIVLPDEALFDPQFTSVEGMGRKVSELLAEKGALAS